MRSDRLLIDRSVGWMPEWRERRDRHLTEIHARVSEWLAVAPSLDAPFIASRHLPADNAVVSPYAKDVLVPLGIADVMHLFLMQTPTHVSELVIMHHQRYGVATEREIELAALLLPHLRRAVTISQVLEAKTIEHRRLADALDALSCGVVLTDKRGTVLHPNRAAEQMLCPGGPLQSDGGVLRARHPAAARELRAAILHAAEDETAIGATGLAVRLTASDDQPMLAHVLPMAGSDRRREMHPDAVAAIFVGQPPDEREAAKALATAFQLTHAETRFLANLLSGKTLAEVATHLDIAPSTAKTHLGNVFAKTGTCRQADLMRLAMQMLPRAR
ncbi:helix-turn-helix transcriptional regulator [Pseudaminobacter soli (ex Li et al. 2025)]|uniref:helix-turn-helix transcriptional regulator n=1 Tax=Pseudaminobacter soli (ex Li et al. 2025) TaxID=1295366 RepID=UPI002476FDCB|nr:LuxR C-terminal-related transcriptional regulator [Mesorhizobium soli]